TKRAAAAEISPDVAERRSASVISGTSRFATLSTPRSAAENEVMATTAATTVIADTTAKAVWSFTLIPTVQAKPAPSAGTWPVLRDFDQLVDSLERSVGVDE